MNLYDILNVGEVLLVLAALSGVVRALCSPKGDRRFAILPYVVYIVSFYLWFLLFPQYAGLRSVVSGIAFVLAAGKRYENSVYMLITCQLIMHLIVDIADSLSFILCRLLSDHLYVEYGGELHPAPYTYLVNYCLILAIGLLLYRMLSNYAWRMDGRSFLTVCAGFAPVAAVECYQLYEQKRGAAGVAPVYWFVVLGLSIVFIIQFLYLRNASYLREQKKEDDLRIRELQSRYDYYRDMQQNDERVRSIYHDMKNHLLLLEQEGTAGERGELAARIMREMAEYEDFISTGNEFLDVILRDKMRRARENKIDLLVAVDFGEADFLEPLDISTIFGNALDNALEASMALPEGERMITFRAGRIQEALVVRIENRVREGDPPDRERNTALHGFGIPNMIRVVEKYDGACSIAREAGCFCVKLLFPLRPFV